MVQWDLQPAEIVGVWIHPDDGVKGFIREFVTTYVPPQLFSGDVFSFYVGSIQTGNSELTLLDKDP